MIWCQPRSDNEHDDDKNKNEDGEDDDVNSPQILVESFSLCNNFVMGAAVSAPSHLEKKILIRVQNQISGVGDKVRNLLTKGLQCWSKPQLLLPGSLQTWINNNFARKL